MSTFIVQHHDETALRELSEGVTKKLKLLTDAEFAELEFPLD